MDNNRIGTYEAAVREIGNKDKRQALKYWKDLLEGFDTRTEIPSFGEVPKDEQSKDSELGTDIDSDVTAAFLGLCKSEETTVSIGAQLGWGMVLHTYSRSEDVVFAKVVSGRDNTTRDVNSTIGLFINTVPVRMTITDKSTARQMLHELQEQSVKSSEYDYCALSEIQAQTPLGSNLFQTVMSFQNFGSGAGETASPQKKRSFRIKSAVLKEESFDDLTPVVFLNNDRLHINLRFDKKKYKESQIRGILNLFETFVRGICTYPDRALVTLNRVSESMKARVLEMSTGPELLYDTGKTWIDMFLDRVQTQPDHVAVTDEEGSLSYGELDRLSDSVARYLLQQEVNPDDFVVIKMHRHKEFAAAVIGVHKAGACYVPIDPDYPKDRIAFMESDCASKLVLDRELVLKCALLFPDPSPVHITKPEHLAYMIYTSGSTGKPKGAMIPQSALMNYTQIYIRRFGVTEKDRLSHHITFSFDSHIRDFYPALAAGASLHFMSDSIVREPSLIYEFLNDNKITGAAFATSMGQLLLTEYDLKLRFVSLGGEALRGITGSDIHVYNVCGATEVTDVVLDYELKKGRYYESVPIGRPLENCYAFILDQYGNLLPKGVPGEICYAGRNVGNGYWNRDDLNRAVFTDCPYVPGMTMYHTRDLGRYNEDGEVEYMGRLDFQVKLRGFRIELGEVESNAISYKGMKQVVALVREDHLCLYYTADETIDTQRLRDYLAMNLAEYMVPDAYMQLSVMPLTPSGKIDKKSLPRVEVAKDEIIPPEGEVEQELYDIVRKQLNYDDFGVTSNLVSQGLTSLGIMRLSGLIQSRFNASVSVTDLMKEPFIRNIAKRIEEGAKEQDITKTGVHSYEKRSVYPASQNQIGVYLDWEMNRDTTQYNIPTAFCLTDVDAKVFAGAIQKTILAHPCMNTNFEIRDGQVVQLPGDVTDIDIPITELTDLPDEAFFQKLVRPFDLNKDRLYRFRLFKYEGQTWMFMDVHHIIFDGLSSGIFMSDVLKSYEGQPVEREKITAYDFALYEKEQQEAGAYEEAGAYFNELLSDHHVMSYPNSAIPDGTEQGEVSIKVDAAVIDGAARRYEVTSGSFIHAAFGETMGRFIREDNPVYLTITNGRRGMPELDHSIGMFVKTVPVVCHLPGSGKGSDEVKEFVALFSDQLQNTYRREIYPYTKLVEETGLHGEILFVYQGGLYEGGEVEGAEVIELKLDTLKFPLTITAYPIDDSYEIRIEYDGKRYGKRDMELLAVSLKQVICDMAYEDVLSKVRLLPSEYETEIIERSMTPPISYDKDLTWIDLFKESVGKFSDNTALVDEERSLTYSQLNEESDAVASYLLKKGISENEFVALYMDRCCEFVVAVIGIHKAGAAYVPVDINYPDKRREFMLKDSEAKVILTKELVKEAVSSGKEAARLPFAKPEGFAYMIYTSGSTGRPKGTILHHRGLLNFALAAKKENELTSSDRIGHHFSFSFDSHIEDLYPPLLAGASIHIMPESVRRDLDLIYGYLMDHHITGGGFTTSIGRLMAVGYKLPQRYMALMGEALRQITPGDTTIINKYGPTECTNIVATYTLEKGRSYKEVPIGRPMPGGAVFIVDTREKLVPFGCVGELCYAGSQVGYGYWKLEDKTEEVFGDCPWIEDTRLYHTGDLARYGEDSQLEYLGRIDSQVKINGFRVEFGEIESTALRCPSIRQAAVLVKQGKIVLYYTEEENSIGEAALREHMSENLADHMMPGIFMRLDVMPTTPSGKIDKRALPEPVLLRSTKYVPPVTRTQKAVTICLRKILGLSQDVGLNDNFFELGGDSIKAIRLVSLLREEDITVSVADIMKAKTAAGIAERAAEGAFSGISQEPVEGIVGAAPITEYFRGLDLPVPAHFNQSICLECKAEPVPGSLQHGFDVLTYQHDMLRAVMVDGELVIRGTDHTIQVERYECDNLKEVTAICNKIQSGIQMDKALMRAALFHVENRWFLVMTAHHLIIDGVSWRIIIGDLEKAYNLSAEGREATLPQKTNTYRDYADAMRHYRDSYALSLEIPYWKSVQEKLEKYPLSTENDYSRNMHSIGRTLDGEKTKRLIHADLGKMNADMDDILLTAVSRSYCRLFGEDGVTIQFEGHGREDIGEKLTLDRTVGWFTSIYPMVAEHLSGDMMDDLIRVKEARHRVPKKGVGYNTLRFLNGSEEFQGLLNLCPRIGFNYFGEMDAEQDGDAFFKISNAFSPGNPVSDKNTFGPDLSIDTAVSDGKLTLGLKYNTAVCSDKKADELIDGIFDELKLICDLIDAKETFTKTPSDLGEKEWSIEEFDEVMRDFHSRDEEIQRIYPMTSMQESMLLKHINEPESLAYRLGYVFEVDTLLSREVVQRAVDRLLQKHEVLRTAFIYEGVSVPRQAIVSRKVSVELSNLSGIENCGEAAKKLRIELLHGFKDLQREPNFRVVLAKTGESSCYLFILVHHMLVDGWCNSIYMSDLYRFIIGEMSGNDAFTNDEENLDGYYERAIRDTLLRDKRRGLLYWDEFLKDYDGSGEIRSFGPVSEENRCDEDTMSVAVDEKTTGAILDLCRQQKATVSNAVELLWGLVLQTCNNSRDVVFCKVVSGRDYTENSEKVVGLFINSVPVRVSAGKTISARQMLSELRKQSDASSEWDFCPLTDIQKNVSGSALSGSVLAFENYNSGLIEMGGAGNIDKDPLPFVMRPFLIKEEVFGRVDPLTYIDDAGQLVLKLAFDRSAFTGGQIQMVLKLFENFAKEIVNSPDLPVVKLKRSSEEDIARILKLSRGEALPVKSFGTWLDMFKDSAEKYPSCDAVTDDKGKLTYRELDQRSDAVASYLLYRKVERGSFVAVKMPRVKEYVIAILGINKAGAAFVPVDPDLPKDRIDFMLKDAGCSIVLDLETIKSALKQYDIKEEESRKIGLPTVTSDDRAYMIYTSGSTGEPKGVVQSHRSLYSFVKWRSDKLNIDHDSRHGQYIGFSFDASLDDLICPLCAGGQVFIMDVETRNDLDAMDMYVRANNVTAMALPAQIGMALINAHPDIPLSDMTLGGERLLPVKKTKVRLINEYGPTEFTVCSSYYEVDQEKDLQIPIGRPVPGSASFILDEEGNLLPAGVVGELCLAGNQLAEGYHNRPDLTGQKFVDVDIDGVTTKVYRTGDLARFDENGLLIFHGREDRQIKIRGYRVESGEIESCAENFAGITNAALDVRKEQLVLFYTSSKEINENELKDFLSGVLADYMVPTVYVHLEKMPLTSNGKTDYRHLPDITIRSAEDHVPPAGDVEITIAEVIRQFLGLTRPVGALDDFFALGGDSIKTIRMISALRKAGIQLKAADVMKARTVRAMAAIAAKDDAAKEDDSHKAFHGKIKDAAITGFFRSLRLAVPGHFGQALLLTMEERADVNALTLAWNSILVQHDMLRAIWIDDGLYVREDTIRIPLEEYEAAGKNVTDICNTIQGGIKMDQALIRAALIHTEDRDLFFMAAHHLIIDSVSWSMIRSDLETAYEDALRGEEVILPEKTVFYGDYAAALYEYRDSFALTREIPYWDSVEKKLKSLCSDENTEGERSFAYTGAVLDEKDTRLLIESGFGDGSVTMAEALITAVVRSYAAITGDSKVSLQFEGHGRQNPDMDLDPDRTVGWFTAAYPLVLEDVGEGEILEDLINARESLRRVPNRGVGYMTLRYLPGKKSLSESRDLVPQIGFNYLGESGSDNDDQGHFRMAKGYDTGLSMDKRNAFGPDLSLNIMIASGCLYVSAGYSTGKFDDERIRIFLEGMLGELKEIGGFIRENKEQFPVLTSDVGEMEWSVSEYRDVEEEFAERGETISRIYPLLPLQQGMLLYHIQNPEGWGYRLVSIYEMTYLPSAQQMKRVLKRLGQRHEVFRTAIVYKNVSVPRQVISDRQPWFKEIDLSGIKDREKEILKVRRDILTEGFDLQDKPLFGVVVAKTSENSCYVVTAVHHIIVDGWCIKDYMNDLFGLIAEEITGNEILPTSEDTPGSYEAAVREILGRDKEEALEYFNRLLSDYQTRAEIPSYGAVPVDEQSETSELRISLDKELTGKLKDLCRTEHATMSQAAEMIWALVLQTYDHSDDVVFTKVVSGRDLKNQNAEHVVGMFINSVPVRVKTGKDTTTRRLLRMMAEQAAETSMYDFCPLEDIQGQSELGSNLSQSVFSYENFDSGVVTETASEKEAAAGGTKLKQIYEAEENYTDIHPFAFLNGEGELTFAVSFDRSKYRRVEIERILSLVKVLAFGLTENPDLPVRKLPRLSDEDAKAMMKLSRGKDLSYNTNETWMDMFLRLVKEQPDHLAVTDDDSRLTYSELNRQSDAVAGRLLNMGVKPDEFVVIKLHRVKEFAVAVLGIHKVGACYVPIDPDYPKDRIEYMEKDCGAGVILTKELVKKWVLEDEDPKAVHLTRPENLAYMIYTSGSTGLPKGAMIPQSALMNYTQIYVRRFEVTPDDRVSHHITFSFDSHIRDFYPALAAGASLHIMPDRICKDPEEIYDFLIKNHITVSAFATAMGRLLINGYDLKQRVVSVGGEALLDVTGGDVRIINICGATEVTDIVLDYELEKGRYYEAVPLGRPLENCYAFILDEEGNLLPQGVAGEICYVGRNVGNGYWHREDLTKEVFTDCPLLPGQTMYRTRDLGRYNEEGNVEYLGRLDLQIKLRGYRIELGEVESNALRFEGMKQVVADVREGQLVLYFVADKKIDTESLSGFLSQSLTDYMVPTVFIQLETMPMTPSGKYDRKNLPAPGKGVDEITAPEDELENELLNILKELIRYDDFGVTNNLVALGLNSLGIMRLSGIIQSRFGAHIRVADIMREPFVRSIAALIREQINKETEAELRIHSYGIRETYPVTENQRGIFLDWEMHPDTTQYNVPSAFGLKDTDPYRLKEAIISAVSAHSYLKVGFTLKDGELLQVRRDDIEIKVDVYTPDTEPTPQFFQDLVQPFDLLNDVLFRFKIYALKDTTWVFMDIHHIIYDGLSSAILMDDIQRAYAGEHVSQEFITAFDLALYEKERESQKDYQEAEKYFEDLVSRANVLSIPDSKEPDGCVYGRSLLRVPADIVDMLARECEVTAGSLLQAAFSETLMRLTREKELLYLTISSGRGDVQDLDHTVGMFVKTLPVVRTVDFDEDLSLTVRDYVRSVHAQLEETTAREFYPYTRLVERFGKRGEILFIYQGGLYEGGEIEDSLSVHLKLDEAKVPLYVTAYPDGKEYVVSIEYDGRRYGKADMDRITCAMGNVINGMSRETYLKDVSTLSEDEEKNVVASSAGEVLELDESKTWLDLFDARKDAFYERLAVTDDEGGMTYRELDAASDAVAIFLTEKGIKVNDFVALEMDRVKEFAVAVLGIHKAGAAYLPIDRNYPKERREYMLSDSGARLLLTGDEVKSIVRDHQGRTYSNRPAKPDGYAYMIYTSGSTGLPKGVLLHHRGLLNFTLSTVKQNSLKEDDRIGLHFSFSFDSHIEDIYPVLLSGASIHIMPERIRRDPEEIADFIRENGITGGGFTTSVARLLLLNYKLPLRYMTAIGEALTKVEQPKGIQIINKYGPTECTNVATLYYLKEGVRYEGVPIGKAMPNGYAFILDPKGKLLPKGAIGELCYAGPQVGYGYWKLEDKTGEVFGNCPFVDGIRMYRTGDLACYDPEGDIEYHGRMDFQVKVNGYRVEPGEIEKRALELTQIKQAAAIVRDGQIVLYYTLNEAIVQDDIKNVLSRSLAHYMVPSVFMELADMPLTPSGKIDKKAMPEPKSHTNKFVNEAPATKEETIALKVLRELLPGADFGVTDDLFEAGLNSLIAMKLVAKLTHECGGSYKVGRLLGRRNIRDFLGDDSLICRYHLSFVPEKPVLVVPSGNTTLVGTEHLYRSWDRYFNILVIEPLAAHYEKLLSGKSFDEVVTFYLELVKRNIPEGAKLFGFTGFSFGGEIAYHLALKWNRISGEKPVVIMGDTYLKRTVPVEQVEQLTSESFGSALEKFMISEGLSMDEILYMANLMRRLDATYKDVGPYDGPVVYINARKGQKQEEIEDKLELLNELVPKAEVIDLPDQDHGSIFLDPGLEDLYLDIYARFYEDFNCF